MKKLLYFVLSTVFLTVSFFNIPPNAVNAFRRKGIDVSTWNKTIDWRAVKKDGIQFAMIRTSYGWSDWVKQTDDQLLNNIIGAKSVGIPIGAYHYSYATNCKEALKEARFFISRLKWTKWEYPVCLDIEDPCQLELTNKERTDIALTFLRKVKAAGYYTGIYTNLDWVNKRLDMDRLKEHTLWFAQWNSECNCPRPYGMWQYTDAGMVKGISTLTDLNYSYRNYPLLIKKAHLNGF